MQRFIADVHLGKLARLLRLAGFNTLYQNVYTVPQLAATAMGEGRVLLSKNTLFLRARPDVGTFIITTDNPTAQLWQVARHFHLMGDAQPFTRCLVCNGRIEEVEKEKIAIALPPNTATYYHEFWQCTECKRVYWKGPHYNRMMDLINGWRQNANR